VPSPAANPKVTVAADLPLVESLLRPAAGGVTMQA